MKNKKLYLVIALVGVLSIVLGVTYAFFTYNKVGANQKIIAGDISMSFLDNIDSINLVGVFPETIEEARSRDDNYVTFTIEGTNTSNKTIYYEIDLIHGDDETSLTRFNDKDLRFDLMEVVDGEDTIINENVSFDEINNSKIGVDTVDNGTSNYSKTYKIRMWLDENVLISDTNSNASYSASTYKNHYASIKVRVVGDFEEKTMPQPVYYAYADIGTPSLENLFAANTDIMTIPGITNNYSTIEHNTFIKFEGPEKSVCAIINGNLECFKNNNYENEKVHLQSIFEETDCYDDGSYFDCGDVALDCNVNSNGDVVCIDFSTNGYCALYGDGSFGCFVMTY